MEEKYFKLITKIVDKLSDQYNVDLNSSTNDYEYYTVFTAALVFKIIAEVEFKKAIKGLGDDDVDDICRVMEDEAKKIAVSILNKKIN